MSFQSKDGKVRLVLSDKENDTSNTYKQDIVGECTGDYSLDVKIENIRLLPGDYNVKVSKALISEWNNTCLLYTSPSPRDGLLSRMPSSA